MVVSAVVALVARVARAISTAALLHGWVVAVSLLAAGSALGVLGAAGFGTGVAVVALRQLRLVSIGAAARKALSKHGHHGQAVRLGLGADAGGAGQEGNRGGSSEEHLDLRRTVLAMFSRVVSCRTWGLLIVS